MQEISELTALAQSRYQFTPPRTLPGPMGILMGVPISTDTSRMAEMLAASPNVDHDFLVMTIPHHSTAIVTANEEWMNGGLQRLRDMSLTIRESQAREIGEMQSLLDAGV
jgi:uncharacterized protein (DUF305 family)